MKGVPWRPGLVTASSLAADTLLVSWIIAWTGGASSPCLPFYLTPVMAASFRFGPWGSIASSLLSLAGYLLAGSTGPVLSPGPAATPGLVLRILSLFAASGFGIGALHRKLERYRREKTLRRELETANARLARAYRDLQSTQEQLLHAEKLASIGTLVAGVAHEINNPISFVYGNLIHLESYVARLKSLLALDDGLTLCPDERRRREAAKTEIDYDYLGQDLDRALADCRDGAERIRRIVEVLLRFSRLRRGAIRRVELPDLVESTLRLLAGKLTPKIRVVREHPGQAAVAGDPDELGQLLLNLLANAADAVEGGGTITVRTTPADPGADAGRVRMEIEDTGPGVPPEHRHRIFEPFFTTKDVGKGTGLGLSIVYSIVKRHRGDISVSSPPAGGTRFCVSLPAWCDPGTGGTLQTRQQGSLPVSPGRA
jgi:signal transduction histidine kinase